MEYNSNEFRDKLKQLCDENWKAKGIMKANNNDFLSLPDYQQTMFLAKMGIAKLEIKRTIVVNDDS